MSFKLLEKCFVKCLNYSVEAVICLLVRFELSSKMREACLILKNHLNDDIKTLKSKEVVRPCILIYTFNFNNEAVAM